MAKVWFITGTSKGFGRIWAEAALERGDQVIATARNVDTIAGLAGAHGDSVLALPLDVTDKPAVTWRSRRRTSASTSSSTTPATGCSARSRS